MGRPKPFRPEMVDAALPGQQLLRIERVATACLIKREQTAADCRNHLRLAADGPAFGVRSWQIGGSQRTIEALDMIDPWPRGFAHRVPLPTNNTPKPIRSCAIYG